MKPKGTSRYRGVHRGSGVARPWHASISVAGRMVPLGAWRSERAAAEAFDRAARHYAGEQLALNFPGRWLPPADAPKLLAQARRRSREKTSSDFLGVTWVKSRGLWRASITDGGRRHWLGNFADEEDAARSYDQSALLLKGARARLNFDPVTGVRMWGRRLVDGAEADSSPAATPAKRGEWAERSTDELIEELRRLGNARGERFSVRHVPRGMWRAIQHRLGSFKAARQAAGLPPRRSRRTWSREKVIAEVR